MKTYLFILLLPLITPARAAKPFDLVCGKILSVSPAHDDTGETILKVERQTALSRRSLTFRTRFPLSARAKRDAATVRRLANSRDGFCAQSFDGVHLVKFSASAARVTEAQIPGLRPRPSAKL